MKLTTEQLRQLVKEGIEESLNESMPLTDIQIIIRFLNSIGIEAAEARMYDQWREALDAAIRLNDGRGKMPWRK
tara:strand:- start:436 stop:657 length:222 start_codon:yes stop_codon:yes gene_type:complete